MLKPSWSCFNGCAARLLRLLLILSLSVSSAGAASNEGPELSTDDFLLLEVRLGNILFDELVTAYQHAGGVVLPLGQLSNLLDIAIDVRPGSGQASGFILQEERRFHLDVRRGELTLRGRAVHYDKALVLIADNDIYVDSGLLASWLPVDLDADLFSSRLTIIPREPLPRQQREERLQRIRMARLQAAPDDPGYPAMKLPYAPLTVPLIDQSLSTSMRQDPTGGRDVTTRFSTLATGELLYMSSVWYLEGDQHNGLQNYRGTLSRRDASGRMLGPLRLTEFGVGHVIYPSLPLISLAQSPSPGFLISSYPLDQQNTFDTHTFQGDLPPGWEVELYHNNALLDYQQASEDGLYKFEDVRLLFGTNYFRLVFYGPHGQQREEVHRFNVGRNLTPPGSFYYRLAQRWDEDARQRTEAQMDVGLHKRLGLGMNYAGLEVEGLRRRYGQLALRTFFGPFFFQADYTAADDGGSAAQASFQTRLLGISMHGASTWLSDFASEALPAHGDAITRQDTLRLDGALAPNILPRLPLALELQREIRVSGRQRLLGTGRAYVYSRGYSLSNQVRVEKDTVSGSYVSGNGQLSRRVGNHGVRANLYYDVHPEKRITSVTTSFDSYLSPVYRLSFNANRSLADGLSRYSVGLNKNVGAFALGTDLAYASNNEVTVNVGLFMSLGRQPGGRGWTSSARPFSQQGAVAAQVFLDRNQNGVWDGDEEALPGVGFSVNRANRKERTADNGSLLLTGLPPHRQVDLGLSVATLADPAWVPGREGVRFTPRPGSIARFDFPVVETGEIDGTTFLMKDGEALPVGDVNVELVNGFYEVVGRATSAYDGFFIISNIPPGTYRLRIDNEQLARLGLQVDDEAQVVITSEDLFQPGIDITLRQANRGSDN